MKDVAALLRGLRSDDGADSRKVSGGPRPDSSDKWAAPVSPTKPTTLLGYPAAQARSLSPSSSSAYYST
ncbi:hypothetical protein PR202_gb26296 [Eleusine coracana subsp. coracana]|uniref:Uncharacterized protein n=1 Tax=Eleusine coracana subsp. coracana TaxID=191504 RepID=A0AAV5FR66_ELECO|nr:hypothetical protein PR202_gb26296 [Eleusine coracana subsp. coracana]